LTQKFYVMALCSHVMKHALFRLGVFSVVITIVGESVFRAECYHYMGEWVPVLLDTIIGGLLLVTVSGVAQTTGRQCKN
jgi:hypothetical protein